MNPRERKVNFRYQDIELGTTEWNSPQFLSSVILGPKSRIVNIETVTAAGGYVLARVWIVSDPVADLALRKPRTRKAGTEGSS